MPWVLSGAGPNWNTGNQAVPTSLTVASAVSVWMTGVEFTNTTPNVIKVTVTETTATSYVAYQVDVPPNSPPVGWQPPFRPLIGVKWMASATGVYGQMWGYTQ